jgi:hypothetical protein
MDTHHTDIPPIFIVNCQVISVHPANVQPHVLQYASLTFHIIAHIVRTMMYCTYYTSFLVTIRVLYFQAHQMGLVGLLFCTFE